MLEAGSGTKFQLFLLYNNNIVERFLGLTRNLGVRHVVLELWLSSIHILGILDGNQE